MTTGETLLMLERQERIWGEAYVRQGNMALQRALRELKGCHGRVLEVGCGAGRFIRTVKRQRPDLAAHGCDLGIAAVRHGQAYGDAVAFAAADLTALPYASGQFDVVLLFDVLEHLLDPARGLAEIRRVLRPGGFFHALVPCEGEPLTLHWLLWRLDLAADLKERHGAHVQRFTKRGVLGLLRQSGLAPQRLSYSMHPVGQARDILAYLAREPWFRRWRLDNPLYQLIMRALWAGAYGESALLAGASLAAVVLHVSAIAVAPGEGYA